MENSIDIFNELKELSPVVAAIKKVNVFTVPEGYFESLSNDILTGIRVENGTNNEISDIATGDVPAGYFDSLAGSILTRIKTQDAGDAAAEIRALSPMLYSIQNENVFEVPPGYFESLSDAVLNKVKPQPKVIKMQRRSSTFLKYAVAAVFTGVITFSVFKFTGNAVKESDLPDYVKIGLNDIKDIDKELAKISDAEIVKFLEAGGTDVKAAYVANSIDKNELPAQEEYLLDDQALDKYLNSINLDDLQN
jgi:hypothetical protein